MAEVKEEKKAYVMTDEEKAFRAEVGKAMADKVAQGKAVWQTELAKRPTMHLPLNPNTGNYFQNGTALMLMQAQFELGTPDNRWISSKALYAMHERTKEARAEAKALKEQIEVAKQSNQDTTALEDRLQEVRKDIKDVIIRKGEASVVSIIQNHKPIKMFNYSQLDGRDVPTQIVMVDRTKDHYGEQMLKYMNHKASEKASQPEQVTAENFFDLARKAYANIDMFIRQQREQREDYAAKSEPYLAEYDKRLEAVKAIDPETFKPKKAEEHFMLAMAEGLKKSQSDGRVSNGYVYSAVKKCLLHNVAEKKIKEFIDKLVPVAAKDPAKAEVGIEPYRETVFKKLGEDKRFQQELEAARQSKSKAAAR